MILTYTIEYSPRQHCRGAEHVLGTIALVILQFSPVVERMGSIMEHIKDVRGNSKTSSTKKRCERY